MQPNRVKLRALAIAAAVFGITALLFLFFLDSASVSELAPYFIAPIVTALVAAFFWWLMLRLDPQVTLWRSAIFGFIIGLAVHPVIWYLIILFSDLLDEPFQFLGELGPLEGLVVLPVLTLVSWLFLGWLTGPIGALVGAGIAYFETGRVLELQVPWSQLSEAYTRQLPLLRRILSIVGIVLLVLAGGLVLMACVPVSVEGLGAHPNPAPDYATARARFEALNAQETGEPWLDVCHTRLMTHEKKTERVIVMLHGYTNCPRQYWELGEQFYARGYNVLMLRMPLHVNRDFDVAHLNELTAEKLSAHGDEAIDLAAGFGDEVYVIGLSGGGAVAGWIAQHRPEATRVMLLAPFFATTYVPGLLNIPVMNLAMHLPPIPMRGKSVLDHAYPGNATRGVGEFLRFGEAVRQAALQTKPLAKSIILVTNANDDTVDNNYARTIAGSWRKLGGSVDEFEFDKKYDLLHDMIDVGQENQPIEWTYPALIDLIEGRQPTLP